MEKMYVAVKNGKEVEFTFAQEINLVTNSSAERMKDWAGKEVGFTAAIVRNEDEKGRSCQILLNDGTVIGTNSSMFCDTLEAIFRVTKERGVDFNLLRVTVHKTANNRTFVVPEYVG